MRELSEVFKVLKKNELCKTQFDFSREFLGRSPNYFAILKSNQVEPSTHALMVLHLKLHELATHCNDPTDIASYRLKGSLISLSNKVLAEIKTRCSEGS